MFHTFVLRQRRIARVLREFYLTPLSSASVQPLLALCVEMNPDLSGRPSHPSMYPPVTLPMPSAAPDRAVDAHLGAVEVLS